MTAPEERNRWAAAHSRTSKAKGNDRWMTPNALFDALHAEFGFTLDAAADADTARCARWLGPGSEHPDALEVDAWAPGEAVWCNPPYLDTGRWLEHAAAQTAFGSTVVVLVFASTENLWFHEVALRRAAEVRFVKGRLSFLDPVTKKRRGTAPKGSVVVVFRPGLHRCMARSIELPKRAKGRKA